MQKWHKRGTYSCIYSEQNSNFYSMCNYKKAQEDFSSFHKDTLSYWDFSPVPLLFLLHYSRSILTLITTTHFHLVLYVLCLIYFHTLLTLEGQRLEFLQKELQYWPCSPSPSHRVSLGFSILPDLCNHANHWEQNGLSDTTLHDSATSSYSHRKFP